VLPAAGPPRRDTLTAAAVRDPYLLGLVALAALLAVFFGTHPVRMAVEVVVFWLLQPVLDLMLYATARRIAAAPGITGHPRRFWRALSVAGLILAVGDILQAATALRDPGPQAAMAGALQTICFVGATGWVACVLVGYPLKSRSGRERLRFRLDTATALVAAAVFSWAVTVRPDSLARGGVGLVGALLGTAVLIAAAFAMAKLVLDGDAPVSRAAAAPAIAGIVLQAALTALSMPHPDSRWFHLHLAVRLLPAVLVVGATRLQELQLRVPGRSPRRPPGRRFSVLPYIMIASTYLMLIFVLPPDLDARAVGVLVGVVLTSALVVARQLVAFNDNANLLAQLDTSMRELADHERRFRALVQYSSDITTMLSPDGTLTYVSPSVERVLGHPQREILGRSLVDVLHPEDLKELWEVWQHLIRTQNATVTHQARYRHADGSWRWLEVIARNLTHDPSVGGIVCNSREVTETRELHDQLLHQAYHDGLTGLANRALFRERLAAAVATGRPTAILMIDLDGFKGINDTRGHHVGDAVLLAVAGRLQACIRAADTAARLGGDELAALLPDTDADTAARIAGRFLESLGEPVRTDDGDLLRVRASVGIAAGGCDDADTLLRQADAAMYTAKRRGRADGVPAPRSPAGGHAAPAGGHAAPAQLADSGAGGDE
jgi:diguanylate cyclase (GGDEF)-like protein/PAS domain S-box-containing protein